jgi:pimeloyl-ACP methyl ester carboxylesterase
MPPAVLGVLRQSVPPRRTRLGFRTRPSGVVRSRVLSRGAVRPAWLRSQPLAGDEDADLSTNTTAHLVNDIEALREQQQVERWTVVGVSWGSTLALAYAEAYPQRIDALLLAAVTTTSRREVEWLTHDVGRIFPREWDRFAAAIPESLRQLPLVDAYATLLFDSDAAVREQAAPEWCAWEVAHVSRRHPRRADPRPLRTSAGHWRRPGGCRSVGRQAGFT